MKAVPMVNRGTQRALANAIGVSQSTVSRRIKDGAIRVESNTVMPYLTEENKVERYLWALNRIRARENGRLYEFHHAYDEIHVDEKWFNISQINRRIYLAPDEKGPERRCKSKRYIMKIMFLAATARPRFDRDGTCIFDGLIGIWPLVEEVVAQRRSINRPAGTVELKPVNINKDVYREIMISKVIPAVRAKWPALDRRCTIRIQQDNAPPHINDDDVAWAAAARDGSRVSMILECQPPNSPDNNINDLSFFRALQAQTWQQTPATTVQGLIDNVQAAFAAYDPKQLNRMWLTHACILNKIIESYGNNNYQIPHMNKSRLERRGELPAQIAVSAEALAHFQRVQSEDSALQAPQE